MIKIMKFYDKHLSLGNGSWWIDVSGIEKHLKHEFTCI
jgi:hypothetical protein